MPGTPKNSISIFHMALDWNNNDGIYLPMINDAIRNQFYEKIIAKAVNGKSCTDVGFGTGFLSILALKHGAKNIIAYEGDAERFALGQQVIKKLGLEGKIELRNAYYNDDMRETEIVLHEIIDVPMWGDKLLTIMPKQKSEALMLPCSYRGEVWAAEVSNNFARGVVQPSGMYDYFDQKHFAPGVDMGQEFIDVISEYAGIGNTTQEALWREGIHEFDPHMPTYWGFRSAWDFVRSEGNSVASYEYDQRPEQPRVSIDIDLSPWQGKNVLLFPRFILKGFGHHMYIDEGHWGPCYEPIVICNPNIEITFSQDLMTGKIDWQ